jgi:hypothetical protein
MAMRAARRAGLRGFARAAECHRIADFRVQRIGVQIEIDEVDQGAAWPFDEPHPDHLWRDW